MHVCMVDINIEKYRKFQVVSLPRVLVESSAGLDPKVQNCGIVNIRIPKSRAEFGGTYGRDKEHWWCLGVWQ